MKVLLFWPYFYPEAGACSSRGYAYGKYLKLKGVDVYVAAPVKKNKKLYFEGTYRIKGIVGIRDLFIFPISFFQTFSLMKKLKPDAVIASSPPSIWVLTPLIAAKMLRIPFILDVRDLWIPVMRTYSTGSIKFFFGELIEGFCYRKSDSLFVVTPTLKELIAEKYGVRREKIGLVSNGVDLDLFKDIPTKKSADLVFLGSINPERRPKDLIDAYSLVFKDNPSARFLFVGWDKNEYTEEILDYIKKRGLEPNIRLIPELSCDGVAENIRSARIGVVTLSEGRDLRYQFPVKVYEYLAVGLPVLCLGPDSDCELKNFLRENEVGFYVSTVEEFAQKAKMLIGSEELRTKLGKNALVVAQRYSRKIIVDAAYDRFLSHYSKSER